MKKLLLFGLLLISFLSYSQNKKVSALTEDTEWGSPGEYMYIINYGQSLKIASSTMLNKIFEFSDSVRSEMNDSLPVLRAYINDKAGGDGYWVKRTGTGSTTTYTLWPVTTGGEVTKLYIGSDPGSDEITHYITSTGPVQFLDEVDLGSYLNFGTYTQIFDSASNQIWFRDITGLYSLSDLTELPVTLSDDWTLDAQENDVEIFDDTYGFAIYPATGLTTIIGENGIVLNAPYIYSDDSLDINTIHVTNLYADNLNADSTWYAINIIDAGTIAGSGGHSFTFSVNADHVAQIYRIAKSGGYEPAIGSIYFYCQPTDYEPSSPNEGEFYYDASEHTLKQYTGSSFEAVGAEGGGQDFSFLDDNGIMFEDGDSASSSADFLYTSASRQISINNATSGAYTAMVPGELILSQSSNIKTLLNPNASVDATGGAYLFKTTNTMTTGKHTKFMNGSDSLIYIYGDSTRFFKPSRFSDSAYYQYLIDAEGDIQWAFFTSSTALAADSLVAAGIGLTDSLRSIYDEMNDTLNGELIWYYKDENGNLVKEYNINGKPSEVIFKLQHKIEHILRYTLEQQKEIDSLKKRMTWIIISALLIILIPAFIIGIIALSKNRVLAFLNS